MFYILILGALLRISKIIYIRYRKFDVLNLGLQNIIHANLLFTDFIIPDRFKLIKHISNVYFFDKSILILKSY